MVVFNFILVIYNRELMESNRRDGKSRIQYAKWKITLSSVHFFLDIRDFCFAEPRGIHPVVFSLILDGVFFLIENPSFVSRHDDDTSKYCTNASRSLRLLFI